MPANERLADVLFPLGGLNLLTEFGEQPPGTTPRAVNVRAVNPVSLRARGGSRMGLKKYITNQLPGVIQHLTVIVDPQAAAFGQNFPWDDLDFSIPDPHFPDFFWPPFGWGWGPVPPSGGEPPEGFMFIMARTGSSLGEDVTPFTQEYAFTGVVPKDARVIAFVQAGPDVDSVSVNDSAMNDYEQIFGYNPVPGESNSIQVYIARNVNVPVENLTVSVSVGMSDPGEFANNAILYIGLVYTGPFRELSPVRDTSVATLSVLNHPIDESWTTQTGNFDANDDDLVVAFIMTRSDSTPYVWNPQPGDPEEEPPIMANRAVGTIGAFTMFRAADSLGGTPLEPTLSGVNISLTSGPRLTGLVFTATFVGIGICFEKN
jgi:hypothetical protein